MKWFIIDFVYITEGHTVYLNKFFMNYTISQ